MRVRSDCVLAWTVAGTLAAAPFAPAPTPERQLDPMLRYVDFDGAQGYGKAKEQLIRDREYELRFIPSRLGTR